MNEETNSKELISITENGMQLTSFNQIRHIAHLLFQSKLVPAAFKAPEQVMVALLRAIELRLPPLQAIEGMTVIGNKVGLTGDLALSMVESSGLLEKKKVAYGGEGDKLVCTVELKRKGRETQVYSFSVIEAKIAGIYDRNPVWRQYPKRMTYYRALGFALRDEFADILKGIKTIEELQDYPDAVHEAYTGPLEDKVSKSQQHDEELKAAGTKFVESRGTRPTPKQAAEPAFPEEITSEHDEELKEAGPKRDPAFGQQVMQEFTPPPIDDLDMSPIRGEPVEQPPQPPAWRDHVIQGVKSFRGRKVGDLNPNEMGLIAQKWIPAYYEQAKEATPEQVQDLKAFEARIAHDKAAKPW